MDKNAIASLLETIGPGRMPPVAYDTAWVARLDAAPDLSNAALDWLCSHQLMDGSWGAAEPFYYHDRVICTLAAMVALSCRGRRVQDLKQIERGRNALEKIVSGATRGLAADPNGATVGFEMIVPTLVAEAERLGLIHNQGGRILGRLGDLRDHKKAKLMSRPINRNITVAFSAEMAGQDTKMLDIDNLAEPNGSVGLSPSATAYYALFVRPGSPDALAYLKACASDDGGQPNVSPFDSFEVAWTLWNLRLTNAISGSEPEVIRHQNFLERAWKPGKGVGFAAKYPVCDGDDTGLVFNTLKLLGKSPDIEAVLSYEESNYFRCYPLEADQSISAHAHILGALRAAGLPRNAPQVVKILNFLMKQRIAGGYWTDKWHLSPYYATSHIIITCNGYAPEIAADAVQWILKTQNTNGSWGVQMPTAEETAYCIQALWSWMQQHTGGEQYKAAIRNAITWLLDQAAPPYHPLWIGKCLYCPENVIRSAILSALSCEV